MATVLKFKDYLWPENPESCRIVCSRPLSDGAQSALQARQVRGEGILSGDLSAQYESLCALLAENGAGTLELAGLPSMQAFLTELEFTQLPCENAMRCRFVFVEAI